MINEQGYGFGGRLSESFPSQILMDVTEVCNLSCIHCPHHNFQKSEHYQGLFLDPMLNKKMVDEVKQHGKGKTLYIRYASNGEPLLHKNIFEMLEYAVNYSNTAVTLTTNGTIMNESRVINIVDIGVDIVDISLDAFKDDTYARIRVGGTLEKTRANVQNLIKKSKEKGSKTKVVVSFVEQPENINESVDFKNFWENQGADYVVVRRFHSCSGAKEDIAVERRKKNEGIERRPCLYPWERIVINARGELAFCPSDWIHGSTITDYQNATIYNIWNGEFYNNLRKAHLENEYHKFKFCGQCPDWEATRWPDHGRSYADMVKEFKDTE